MAGHSQFKNIMHRKGRQDAVRAKIFTKLIREITVGGAAWGRPTRRRTRACGGDDRGARGQHARTRSIARSSGVRGDADANYDEVRYEGYGPAASP
jgi:transcriptional/translational regulatory protein YebC/TACO1